MTKLMSDIDKLTYKKRLLQKSVELIEIRIAANTLAIANAQDAANAEEKSSAGDKYETSRAMSHLEKDMHARQLAANRNELAALFKIDCTKISASIAEGTLVVCSGCNFFIVAGLGKINFDNKDVYLVSPNAPLAGLLFKKQAGDSFIFNKKELVIEAVF
jgi:hypothetical protein